MAVTKRLEAFPRTGAHRLVLEESDFPDVKLYVFLTDHPWPSDEDWLYDSVAEVMRVCSEEFQVAEADWVELNSGFP